MTQARPETAGNPAVRSRGDHQGEASNARSAGRRLGGGRFFALNSSPCCRTGRSHGHIANCCLLRATRLPAFSPGRRPRANAVRRVAPVAGFEPATKGLTVLCATTALHRNKESLSRNGKVEGNLSHSAVPCQSPKRSRRRDCFTSDFERFDVMPRRLTDFSPDFSPLDRKPPVVYTTRSSARVRRWTTPRRRSTRTPQ